MKDAYTVHFLLSGLLMVAGVICITYGDSTIALTGNVYAGLFVIFFGLVYLQVTKLDLILAYLKELEDTKDEKTEDP